MNLLGSVDEVLHGIARCAVERADAVQFVASLPTGSIDGLVTDAPYSSGGAFRGDRAAAPELKYQGSEYRDLHETFEGDVRDQRGWAYWCHVWLSEAFRAMRPGAPIVLFTDWRQLPTTTDVMQAAGFVWRGIVPWDKTEGVRPQKGRFRAQAEYMVWGSRGPMPIERDAPVLPGVFRCSVGDKSHITEKPIVLLRQVVQIVERGGVVLDLFAGSGSTAHAAVLEGRRAITCDVLQTWVDHTHARVATVEEIPGDGSQGSLFSAPTEQEAAE